MEYGEQSARSAAGHWPLPFDLDTAPGKPRGAVHQSTSATLGSSGNTMKRVRGFSLLEMLAALSLIALLMLLAVSSFSGSSKLVEPLTRNAARMEQVLAAQRFLRQSLAGMMESSQFLGEPRTLEYVAAAPLALGGALRLHRLEFVSDVAGGWLLRVAFFDPDGKTWGDDQILVDHLRDVRLAYRGFDDMQRDTGWLDHWPWTPRLPKVVQVKAEAVGSTRWSTLSVVLRTTQQLRIGQ